MIFAQNKTLANTAENAKLQIWLEHNSESHF